MKPRLTQDQQNTLHASQEILENHRAVLLYEAVGTGKTYVAAALADQIQSAASTEVIVVAPAHLLNYWRRVMTDFEVNANNYSFQAASLGQIHAPKHPDALWIIDEAHGLKNSQTKRYQALKRLMARHRIVLVTATPISLGWRDLHALMVLAGFPDEVEDVQALYAFAHGIMPQSRVPALNVNALFDQTPGDIVYDFGANSANVEAWIHALFSHHWRIQLSDDGQPHETLIPMIILQRLLSHPQSCLMTLKKLLRYYKNCQQSSGNTLSKSSFRRLMGIEGTQLLLPFDIDWNTDHALDINANDIPKAIQILQTGIDLFSPFFPQVDHKLTALQNYIHTLGHNTQIIIFTQYVDTAMIIEENLRSYNHIGLLTSSHSRLNGHNIQPEKLLSMFDPQKELPHNWQNAHLPMARILICTDAFSCGQNLQKASVIIHFDLPWNPTVIHQREGRILRNGQENRDVHIARMKVHHAPESISLFESKLYHKLLFRQMLQKRWCHQNRSNPTTYLITQAKGIPQLWSEYSGHWVPISPTELTHQPDDIVQMMTLSTAFSKTLSTQRLALQPIWQKLKTLRFNSHISQYINYFIQFCYQISLFPQLRALLPKFDNFTDESMNEFLKTLESLPLSDIPGPDTPCIKIIKNR